MAETDPAVDRQERRARKSPQDRAVPSFPSGPGYVSVPGGLRNFAKSAVRALEVLDEFAKAQAPLRAIEIGQALGLHASSADQLLKTMVDSGYLLFDDRRKLYFPSPRLALFASWLSHSPFGIMHTLLERIQAQVGEMVMISFRQTNDMQVALVRPRPGSEEIVTPGIRFPLLASGTGIAALSTYDEAELRDIIARAQRYRRDREIVVDELLAQVAEARATGHTTSAHESAGRDVVAVPLVGDGIPRGTAISVSVPLERMRNRAPEIAAAVRRVAAECLADHRAEWGEGMD